METNNNMLGKMFKHLSVVAVGVILVGFALFMGVATAMTGSFVKALILAILVIAVNALLLAGLLLPINFCLKNYNQIMEKLKQGDLKIIEGLNRLESNKLFGKFLETVTGIMQEFGGIIKENFEMIDTLTNATKEVDKHTDEAISAVEQMSMMMQEIATGAASQAAQSQTGQALMTTLAEEITKAYHNGQTIMQETDKVIDLNKKGQASVQTLQDRAASAVAATDQIGTNINSLIGKMKEIAAFVETIESIAAQTNLLALNAAIEAARAGDAGRGFGVVAEEIRKLADESKDSTTEIRTLVDSIETETMSVHEAMNNMNTVSKEEEDAVEDARAVFMNIGESIDEIARTIAISNTSLAKINEDKEQVNHVIEEVASVSQETAAHTEEGASSSEAQVALMQQIKAEINELNACMNSLNKKLAKYKK